jgi:hypothetical protein
VRIIGWSTCKDAGFANYGRGRCERLGQRGLDTRVAGALAEIHVGLSRQVGLTFGNRLDCQPGSPMTSLNLG